MRMTETEAWTEFLNMIWGMSCGTVIKITGFPGYVVNSEGVIYHYWDEGTKHFKCKVKKTWFNPTTGYQMVNISKNGKNKTYRVHELVCTAVHGPRPSKDHVVRHIDNKKWHNAMHNLKWGTRVENYKDSPRKLSNVNNKSLKPVKTCSLEEAWKEFNKDFGTEFKQIPGYENYAINKNGVVYSFWRQRWSIYYPFRLSINNRPGGYKAVTLQKNGKCNMFLLHRLLAITFIGPEPFNNAVVRHLNDNKNDNSLDNLAWGSKQDNLNDAIRNGRNGFIKIARKVD